MTSECAKMQIHFAYVLQDRLANCGEGRHGVLERPQDCHHAPRATYRIPGFNFCEEGLA